MTGVNWSRTVSRARLLCRVCKKHQYEAGLLSRALSCCRRGHARHVAATPLPWSKVNCLLAYFVLFFVLCVSFSVFIYGTSEFRVLITLFNCGIAVELVLLFGAWCLVFGA